MASLNPYPLFRLSGKVVATRETEVPARPEVRDPETGDVRYAARDKSSYGEVALLVPDSVLGAERSDVPAVQTVRCKTEDLVHYRKGETADLLCSVWSNWEGTPGRMRPVVTFRVFEKLSSAAAPVRTAA